VLLVAGVAAVVVAAIGLPITAASTSIITSGAASATRGLLLKVKVIGIYKTLSS
jgi:archaellin